MLVSMFAEKNNLLTIETIKSTMNMMKQYNAYTQGQLNLVSLLLTVCLMVGSNLNITLAAPGSGPVTASKAGPSEALNTTILLPLPPDEKEQKTLEATITARPERGSPSTAAAEIQKNLEEIRAKAILPESAYDQIKALVAAACEEPPSNFDEYVRIREARENLEWRMYAALGQPAANQAGKQAQKSERGNIQRRKQFLSELNILVRSVIDHNSLIFIQNALRCTGQLRELFFTNLLLTEYNINQRYGELTQEFDPKRSKWISGNYKDTAQTLMTSIDDCKDTLLRNLQTAAHAINTDNIQEDERTKKAIQKLRFYQEYAGHFWATAKSCKPAQEDKKKENAIHAYEAYRACCRVVDAYEEALRSAGQSSKYRFNQIQLRGNMARCLNTADCYLEAQLHALGAMKLIFDQPANVTLTVLQNAQKVLIKIQKQGEKSFLADSTAKKIASTLTRISEYKIPNDSATTNVSLMMLMTLMAQCSQPPHDVKGDILPIKQAIQDDLSKIAQKLILNSEPNLVQYQAAEEDILCTNEHAGRYKVAGRATMTGGVLVGGATVAAGVLSILKGAGVVAGATLGGPMVAIVAGTGLIGLGIWGGISLWKKGADLMEKSETCKNLNNMMQQALAYYNQGELKKFIVALAGNDAIDNKEQNQSTGEQTKGHAAIQRLFLIKDADCDVPSPKERIERLAEHGLGPHNIAHAFNLIGEALSHRCLQGEWTTLAALSFNVSLLPKLEQSATKLDKRITEMRKTDLISMIKELGRTLRDFFMLRDEGHLARKHVKDLKEKPFWERLKAVQQVAKLDQAMIGILLSSKETINLVKKLLQEVRDTMDTDGHHTMPGQRFKATEYFLWVASGHILSSQDVGIAEAMKKGILDGINLKDLENIMKKPEDLAKQLAKVRQDSIDPEQLAKIGELFQGMLA